MHIDILTLFPNMFRDVLGSSILGKAQEKKLIELNLINIRDFSLDKHHKTDDYPFGGGAGMVMTADPVFRALKSVDAQEKYILYPSPRGKILDQTMVCQLAEKQNIVLLCGHYEGIDQRILDSWKITEISVGDYILTGGELPAMIIIDAVSRMLPEVLGNSDAHLEESIHSGLLEYPQYTKPRVYDDIAVPEVLLSGNHRLIHLWKFEQSLSLTKQRRPDLLDRFVAEAAKLTKEEKKILTRILTDTD